MDFLFALFALASLVVVAFPIFAIFMLLKARRLEARLSRLESAARRGQAPDVQPQPHEAARPVLPPVSRTPSVAEPASPHQAPATPGQQEPEPAPQGRSVTTSLPSQPQHKSPAAKRERIQWEQWVGIRGAAVLGGLLFALAGILFFKHAFDRGWITPAMRVALGATIGLLALGMSELFHRRNYRFAPAATAGAGLVVLYSTTWASYRLYEFTSALAALPLMAMVTALCAWTAVRFESQLVAILGLVGGFAAPLLLSMQADHPIGLFGYLLLLDLGLLALGQRMRWPSLGLLGMLGTFLVELIWTARHFDPSFFFLALVSLGAFALLFAAVGQRSPGSSRRTWLLSQAGALLLPFTFATYFAWLSDLGASLWPLAILMALLATAASWVSSRREAKWLVSGAAAGSLAVSATWIASVPVLPAWDFALSTVSLSLLFFFLERFFGRSREEQGMRRWSVPMAPAVTAIGFGLMTWVGVGLHFMSSPWPWLVASLGQALLLHLLGRGERAGMLQVAGAGLAGLSMGWWLKRLISRANRTYPLALEDLPLPGSAETLTWMVLACAFFLGLAWWSKRRDDALASRWAAQAAATFAAVLAASQALGHQTVAHPGLVMATSLTLAIFVALPTLLGASARWFSVALLIFCVDRSTWTSLFLRLPDHASIGGDLFLLELGALFALSAVPLLARRTLGASRVSWASISLALILSLGTADRLVRDHFVADRPALSALSLALFALLIFALTRISLTRGSTVRESADRWLLGGGAFLASIALAEAVGHHQQVLIYSYTLLSFAALWRWRPALGLKVLAVVAATLSAIGISALCFRGLTKGALHFESADILLWNWTSYVTGVPALACLVAALLIGQRERTHITNLEQRRVIGGRSWGSATIALAATVLMFIWMNLQVLIYFEPGPMLRLSHDYGPACDLTLSIGWIGYALLLLAVGMARSVAGLRQASLAFLLLTLFKVFLRDLGDLDGLYRVGSLLGLGVSLILVSLLYQRFVFPSRSGTGEAVEGGIL